MRLSWYNRLLDCKGDHKRLSEMIAARTDLKGKSILDVGAGSGLLDDHLLMFTDDITLLEPSPSILKNVDHDFSIIQESLENLETKKRWDIVLAKGTVHHFANAQEDKIRLTRQRLLKMEGFAKKELIIIEPDPRTLSGKWLAFLENTVLRMGSCFLDEDQYKELFSSSTVQTSHWRGYLLIIVRKNG